MLLKQLLLAASAAAFLVVPETTEQDENIFKALPIDAGTFEIPAHAMSQSVDVPCTQCRGRNSRLRMDFEVVDNHALTVNGHELYPNANPWEDFNALVVKDNCKGRSKTLGYSLAVNTEGVDEEEHMEVIGMELHVAQVGFRFMDGIPSVKVKLIKAPSGDILIGSIDILESQGSECTTAWCRIEKAIKNTVKGLKGCGRKGHGPHRHHSGGDMTMEDSEGHEHGEGHGRHGEHGHHGQGHHGHHGHHGHGHRWGRLIKNIAAHIFLPVLMGITAGFGVAVVVMLACSVAMRFTRFVRGKKQACRSRCRRFRHSKQAPVQVVIEEEKVGLIQEQEEQPVPPPYADNE